MDENLGALLSPSQDMTDMIPFVEGLLTYGMGCFLLRQACIVPPPSTTLPFMPFLIF